MVFSGGKLRRLVPLIRWQKSGSVGGQTKPILIANLSDASVTAPKPRDNTNDFNPIWVGDTTYFLSDGTVSSRCLPTTSNHYR